MVHRLRVERARHRLRTTDRTVDDVAGDVGSLNATTLRALLRRFPAAGDRAAAPREAAPGTP
jgi:transcriptional regulator GlxA family with amidase domain